MIERQHGDLLLRFVSLRPHALDGTPDGGAVFMRRKETEMIQSSSIQEHMEVLGSDGKHVGKVDHVMGDQIELAKMDLGAGLKHHLIPVSWIDRLDPDGKLYLSLTQDEAKAQWAERPH